MKGNRQQRAMLRGLKSEPGATLAQREQKGFRIEYPNAAGIDVGGSNHWVCVPPDRDVEPVRCFGSCTADLEVLGEWLTRCRITHVALESTGVYWISLFEFLDRRGFHVLLVNGQQSYRVAARKSDVLDCQWLQQMMTFGLLSGSFRPADAICEIRAVVRLRERYVRDAGRAGQHMDKALVQMNVHLGRVLADLTGTSGLAIIRAMLQGERDPQALADLCDPRVHTPREEVARQLKGNWRREHLLALELALNDYDLKHVAIARCDTEIQRALEAMPRIAGVVPPPRHTKQSNKQRKRTVHNALRQALYQAIGVDLTAIPCIDVDTALTLYTEIGTDLSHFPSSMHFCAWLNLAPPTHISGGKRLPHRPKHIHNRAGEALKQAVVNAQCSQTLIGAAHRARLARMPKVCAIKATAHQLARILYCMLTRGQAYVEQGMAVYEEQSRQRKMRHLRRCAHQLGVKIVT